VRSTFIRTLGELAERDPRIMLLTGDLGYQVVEPFAERFTDRFINVGVAEQNMVGIATGLAEAGFIPFCYSIGTFASLRPYEFIRNGPILHGFQARIVGVGAGFDYGVNGVTHYAIEDVGVMRIQPAMTVIAPADYEQARTSLLATWDRPGPIYYRLGKDEQTSVPDLRGAFELGRAQLIREGHDLIMVVMGSVATEAAAAAEALAARDISAAVAVVASFNPSPTEDLTNLLEQFPLAMTVEAHYVVGGLGSFVSEVIADRGLGCRLVRCGVQWTPHGNSGSTRYLQEVHGISAAKLTETAVQMLRKVTATS
jgi:transketolase